MTIHETPSPTAIEVTLVVGPGVRERREELLGTLAETTGVATGSVRPLAEVADVPPERPVVVVADAGPPVDLPDRQIVWVTTDADVATTVSPAAAVIHWGPGDDPGLLETRLTAELDADRTAEAATVLDHLDEVVFALDADHRFTYLNDRTAALLDSSPAELTGAPIWEHAPDNAAERLRPAVDQALAEGEPVEVSVDPADETALLDVTVHPNADADAVTLHARDMSRRSTGSLYEYLVETVGDGVYVLDDEGHFIYVNDALCEMTGYSREALLGSSVHIIKDDETVAEAEDALRELLKSRAAGGTDSKGVAIANLDVELVCKNDRRIPATDRMTLRPLDDGRFTGTVGTLRDVSRQRRRQEILNGLVERSRRLMRATTADEVADRVVAAAAEVFGFDVTVLRKYDPDREVLAPVAASAADPTPGTRPVPDTDEGPGEAFQTGDLVVSERHPSDDTGLTARNRDVHLPIGDRYVLSVGDGDESFDPEARQLLEVFAGTAAAAFDRVRREEHLRQYEAVVEAAEDMLFTVDGDGRFTLVTRPFATMLGYARAELVGRPLADFLPTEDAGTALSVDGRTAMETTLQRADNDVPARVTLAPLDGSVEEGLVGTVRDLSELRSAQQEATRQRRRFTELFETLSDPVADVVYTEDADGDEEAVVESANPAFATLCDRDPEQLRGEPLATVQAALPDALAQALEPVGSSAPAVDTTVTAQTPTGERQFLLRTAAYDGDQHDRAFVLLTDVTEVRRRGTHLKVLHRLLRHNLRNETALIKGHAEQLQRADLAPDHHEHVETVLSAADELITASETSQTVQRVLGMDASAVDPIPAAEAAERVRTALTNGLEEVVVDPGGTAADGELTAVTVSADTEGRLPFSRYLLIAIQELVENAAEHPPASEVGVEVTDADAGGVRVTVTDDGDGLPAEQWDLLTGDREITQLQHGDGLGLWLVKWVTDQHGGRLRLEEADADGTTVSLVFPEPESRTRDPR